MRFIETPIEGAFLVEMERLEDDRGSFGRAWCAREFAAHGIETGFVQANVARTKERGTVRGLHYQTPPHQEAKLVRCTRGGVFDVIVDVRPDSRTRHRWYGVELPSESDRLLFAPAGCAHGYQALEDGAEVIYLSSTFYAPASERGVRYDDPGLRISWPLPARGVSEKDRSWPLVEP